MLSIYKSFIFGNNYAFTGDFLLRDNILNLVSLDVAIRNVNNPEVVILDGVKVDIFIFEGVTVVKAEVLLVVVLVEVVLFVLTVVVVLVVLVVLVLV